MQVKKSISWKVKFWLGSIYVNGVTKMCYTSIGELPIYNWWQAHSGDVTYLLKDRKIVKRQERALKILWHRLYNQFLKEVYLKEGGIGDTMLEIIKKNRKITLLYLEMSAKGKGINRTWIQLAEKELALLYKEIGAKHETGFYEIKSEMEERLGFAIDIHKTSVRSFYGYVEMLKKRNEKQKKHDNTK